MHSFHANRAVPHALEGALLLRSTGFGAREAEALGTRPAEWRRGIAEGKASVVQKPESHAGRHGGSRDGGLGERKDRSPVIGGRGVFRRRVVMRPVTTTTTINIDIQIGFFRQRNTVLSTQLILFFYYNCLFLDCNDIVKLTADVIINL